MAGGAFFSGDMDFDPAGREGLDPGFGGRAVGDDDVDLLEVAEWGEGFAAELRVVEQHDDRLGGAEHLALDVDEESMGVAQPVFGEAARAHDSVVHVDIGERLHGERADEDAQSRVDNAPGDDDLDLVVARVVVGDREGVGHNLGAFGAQLLGRGVNGGAGVADHAAVGLDPFRAGDGDRFLFRGLARAAVEEVVFVGFWSDEPRAAVSALEDAARFERVEVSADRRRRRLDAFGKLFERSEFHISQIGFYGPLSRLRFHFRELI